VAAPPLTWWPSLKFAVRGIQSRSHEKPVSFSSTETRLLHPRDLLKRRVSSFSLGSCVSGGQRPLSISRRITVFNW